MKRPPIEGLPTERPRCAHCNKPLTPWVKDTKEQYRPEEGGLRSRLVRREFDGMWRGYPRRLSPPPIFCTLKCALQFAQLAHEAGYRIVRKENQ
jgi:hypothetical protein